MTAGQELTTALLIEERIRASGLQVYSLSVLPGLKGLIIAEAPVAHIVQRAVMGLRHVRGVIAGAISFEELEKFVAPKPVIELVNIDDIVEITSGPFAGMQGRVREIDKSKGEVKVEITEAAYPLPITIPAEYLRIIGKSSKEAIGA